MYGFRGRARRGERGAELGSGALKFERGGGWGRFGVDGKAAGVCSCRLFANPESDRCLQTLAVSTLEAQSPKALYYPYTCCEAHVWSSYLTTVSIPRTQITMPGQLLIDTLVARLEPGPVEPKGP